MHFDNSYFEDEVRMGFYVPGAIKRAWAAELEVLSKIDALCQKYNISYFADWGSLLATVRHGGFIPWDDDLDIVMRRNDYERFREVASELPNGYEVYNYRERNDYWLYICRVTGKNRICFEADHLERFHNFPYIAGVDIFVLDNISDDESRDDDMRHTAHYVIVTADKIAEGKLTALDASKALENIDNKCGTDFLGQFRTYSDFYSGNDNDYAKLRRDMYVLAEKLFASFKDEDTQYITQMFPFGMQNKQFRFPSCYYKKTIRLPYEGTTMPVPYAYDAVLTKRYGEYLKLVKNAGAHGYPFYEAQHESLQKLMDFKLPEYVFDRMNLSENICKSVDENADTLKDAERKYMKLLWQISDSPFDESAAGDIQNIAVNMGTLAETYSGFSDGQLKCVHMLEQLCETAYQIYLVVSGQDEAVALAGDNVFDEDLLRGKLKGELHLIETTLNEEILLKKQAVFICFKQSAFKYYEKEYRRLINTGEFYCHIMPVPYYYKAYDGHITGQSFETNAYPDTVALTDHNQFDISFNHPDVIYTQNPYDEWNPVMTFEKKYFAPNLRRCTDTLVYIPWFVTEDFTSSDERQYHNMSSYCLMPGVVSADEVYLQSDTIRDTYIRKLCEWAGDETKEIWEDKLVVKQDIFTTHIIDKFITDSVLDGKLKLSNSSEILKKVLVYHIEIASFAQFENVLNKIRSVLKLFRDKEKSLSVIWYENESFETQIKEMFPDKYDEYKELVSEYAILTDYSGIDELKKEKLNGSNIRYITNSDIGTDMVCGSADAYYGDRCNVAAIIMDSKKPVMICNYEL